MSEADLNLALVLPRASYSLPSRLIRSVPRMLCCRPSPAISPLFFGVQSENSLHQKASPVLSDCRRIFSRGQGSAKPIPARRRRSVSNPFLAAESSLFPGRTSPLFTRHLWYQISFPRQQCRSALPHTTPRRGGRWWYEVRE